MLPQRKYPRLGEYDYSANGVYFITVCTKNRRCIFWTVGARSARPQPLLSDSGKIIEAAIQGISAHYPTVAVEKYSIMPDHLHLLLRIQSGADGRAMRAPTIATVINQFKGYVTKQLGVSVWQKLYYDHIIRNEQEYEETWQYIENNPLKWIETHR